MTEEASRRIDRTTVLLAVLLVGLAAATVGYLLQSRGAGRDPATSHWGIGACHRLDHSPEIDWSVLSDTRPPVDCSSEHQTETYQVVTLTGELAGHQLRPSPILLRKAVETVCSDQELRNYLGADSFDAPRGLHSVRFLPTAEEWRQGDRRVRCDLIPAQQQSGQKVKLSEPLGDILKTPGGSRLRTCRANIVEVGCDRPHDRELVHPWLLFEPEQVAKGKDSMIAVAQALCRPHVESYVGAPLERRGDLQLTVEVPGDAGQRPDSRVGRCWVGPADPWVTLDRSVRRSGVGQ